MEMTPPVPRYADDSDRIRFSHVLRPHRSSSDRAVKIVSGFVFCLFIPTGTLFLLAGAWPVFGFMGLEVAALIFALHYNHKVASAFEAITISGREVRISRVDHWGRRKHWSFQPQWLRIRVDETSRQLIVGSHGKAVAIGRFLTADERESLAAALNDQVRCLAAPAHLSAPV